MAKRAVFLDRDGVLIHDTDLLVDPEQVRFFDGAVRAVRDLHENGFLVVVVSNQSVIARGLVTHEQVGYINDLISEAISPEGGPVVPFYVCPHHPNATIDFYRVDCSCRKPRPGMLLEAAEQHDINLGASYIVGDRPSDIAAGSQAGCRTILVRTGEENSLLIESAGWPSARPIPNLVCNGIEEAAQLILKDAG
jgi:D-glycero-D-manno-heptose 1,7-bisphosphate phosphatase